MEQDFQINVGLSSTVDHLQCPLTWTYRVIFLNFKLPGSVWNLTGTVRANAILGGGGLEIGWKEVLLCPCNIPTLFLCMLALRW